MITFQCSTNILHLSKPGRHCNTSSQLAFLVPSSNLVGPTSSVQWKEPYARQATLFLSRNKKQMVFFEISTHHIMSHKTGSSEFANFVSPCKRRSNNHQAFHCDRVCLKTGESFQLAVKRRLQRVPQEFWGNKGTR